MAFPWPLPPVVGIELYKQDVVVLRRGYHRKAVTWTRADVTTFSWSSRKRLAFVASNTDIVFTSMLTLTYPRAFPNDGRDVKRNLNAMLTALRRKGKDVAYLWFLEFQKRGAPHIHILIRGLRVNAATQAWVSQTWYRLCDTGDAKHLRAGTRLERIRKPYGARNYAVKYAHKMQQKSVPEGYRNVGRFWGCSKTVNPVKRKSCVCSNDDVVGALEAMGWRWLKGDTIRYATLYGAAELLTKWVNDAMLEPSASTAVAQGHGLHSKGGHHHAKTFLHVRGFLRADHEAGLRDGGSGLVG